MDINLQLKLGLVNQYLDGQISGIVKETFDDAIRNEALNEIDQRLESGFAIEKTKILITIQMAYSGVFYSGYDIAGYIKSYFDTHVNNEVLRYYKTKSEDLFKNFGDYFDKDTGEYLGEGNTDGIQFISRKDWDCGDLFNSLGHTSNPNAEAKVYEYYARKYNLIPEGADIVNFEGDLNDGWNTSY
ncbi:hypothetical protein [Aquimarina longa]|uniref:hypothetical protein n=1 Tax=Aquimarina longa TaxID=1080221 RepID=UPI000783ADE3|nr:hypothetical protein [Aquimarina longa]